MNRREALLAAALAISGGAVVYGVSLVSGPAAWMLGGLLGGLWAWLVFGEVG